MRLLPIVVVLSLSPAAHAGGALLPPLEIELGQAWLAAVNGGSIVATELRAGLSWASVNPRPTRVDFGVGWHGSFVRGRDLPPATIGRVITDPSDVQTANGMYVDLDLRLISGNHWRTWFGMRGELLGTQGVGVLGGAGRLSAELWHPVVISGNGGGIIGTFALEIWAEIGVRERIDRTLASVVATGLGVRFPLVAIAGK